MFTHKMKLADVVQSNFETLSVLYRFGINLGFGDKSVTQVCQENGINPDFFLDIINTYNDHNYFPQKHLQGFSVGEIVEYLRKTHMYYMQENIPVIEEMMVQMVEGCSHTQEIRLVQNFFFEYKNELIKHITWEDDEIFPYALDVERAFVSHEGIENVIEATKKYSMSNFLDEHDDIEAKLYDIRTLFVKYLPPVANQQLCLRVLQELHKLEKDINDHARIEEKVLGPKVVEMEKELMKLV